MFLPNIPCKVHLKEDPNVYGESQVGPAIDEMCAIVRLRVESTHTTVRADSSASRGYADEFVSATLILLAPTTHARLDDMLVVMGVPVRVKSLFPRYDVSGVLDHFEARGELWA